MSGKIINYTNRDYDSLRKFLMEYARQFYPDTVQDFSEASPGAMLIDMASLIGDTLAYYTDYQGNESILDTARQIENINRLAKEKGYKDTGKPSAHGTVDLYVLIPANSSGEPDQSYIPILKKDTSFSVNQTGASYLLVNDVDFNADNVKKIVARVNSDGIPTFFAFKSSGEVISGARYYQKVPVTTFKNYFKAKLNNPLLSEVLSVTDSNGNEYYQVDYLTQNVVYKYIKNTGYNSSAVPYVLAKFYAPRRFVIEYHEGYYYLVFGNGSADSVTDPRNLVLDFPSRKYVSDRALDPKNIINSDKFGVGPSDTILTVAYRANDTRKIGAAAKQLNKVITPLLDFAVDATDSAKKAAVVGSVEVVNIQPISSISQVTDSEDIKYRAYGAYAAQDRAVSKEDYISLCYAMDPRLGAIKRVNVYQDTNSFKRNLNLCVIGQDDDKFLTTCPTELKNNLKTWLLQKKMINDTVDIVDAKIINLGIEFVCDTNEQNKFKVWQICMNKVAELYKEKQDIGESFDIAKIYKTLNFIPEVIDTKKVKIVLKNGTNYASSGFDIYSHLSVDGDYIQCPKDHIFEVKFIEQDIVGSVI